jgi:hypothetical protein
LLHLDYKKAWRSCFGDHGIFSYFVTTSSDFFELFLLFILTSPHFSSPSWLAVTAYNTARFLKLSTDLLPGTKDDLISLADSADSTNGLSSSPTSPTTFDSISNRMSANKRITAQRDSFSDLAVMMKAKKPYTPIPPPTPPAVPRLALQPTTNGKSLV